MDRAAALAALNRRLLEAYSRRTAEALRAALPGLLHPVLERLEPFLALNVAKEVKKDALIVRQAGERETQRLLAAMREVDREFLRDVARFPLEIVIPYARIEPVRARRIAIGLRLAETILAAWRDGQRLRQAFGPGELERALREWLELYAEETQTLTHSVRLPSLLEPLRERFARKLFDVMREVAAALARETARGVHRRRTKAGAP